LQAVMRHILATVLDLVRAFLQPVLFARMTLLSLHHFTIATTPPKLIYNINTM
jgi:hypothetical protein